MRLKRSHFLLAAVLGGALAGGLLGGRALAGADRADDRMRTFSQIISLIQDRYVEPVDTEELIFDGIRGMLRTLDPHSNFLDPESYRDMKDEQRGAFYGLGIVISKRTKEEPLTVISPIEGTPAARLGIRAGDVITHIQDSARNVDVDTVDLTIQDAVKYLKGPRGTEVVITVERVGLDEPLSFRIVRDKVDTPSVSNAFMIRPGIGYIKLANFTQTSADDLDRAIASLKARGMEQLVFDQRGNPGGLLDQAVKVADRFLSDGRMIVYTKGRVQGSDQEFRATRMGDENTMPVVALINFGSASASEIVAGALQDHDRGLIVGERSFGKGLVQSVYPVSNQTGLALTTAKYYTPSGRLIQRDYSSLEAYLFDIDEGDSDEPQAPGREIRHTETGRVVYGGGGITPDVEVKPDEASKLLLEATRNNLFFKFAVRQVQQIEEFPKEKISDPDRGEALLRSFNPDDATLAAFRAYLAERKVSFEESEFKKDEPRIRSILKAEMLETVGGLALRDRVLLESDPQVLSAIEHLPRARELALLPRPARASTR